MPSVSVTVKGLNEITLKAGVTLIHEPIKIFFQESAKTVWAEVFKRTPRKTGHLQSHLFATVDPAPLPMWAKIGFQGLEYAEWVEYGTGTKSTNPLSNRQPIEIFPVAKQALYWPGAAHPVMHVTQQGQEGRHMLRDGFEAAVPKINVLLKRAGDSIVKALASH